MSAKKDSRTHQAPYEKPRIEKVVLAPEEVLLTGCKAIASGAGKNNGRCRATGLCLLQGS